LGPGAKVGKKPGALASETCAAPGAEKRGPSENGRLNKTFQGVSA